MEAYKKKLILSIRGDSSEDADDLVAVEKRLRISINGRNVLNMYCTPLMIRELVAGIIHNEGLIKGEWCAERISIEYNEEIQADVPSSGEVYEGEYTITSGCAGGISSRHELSGKIISDKITFTLESLRKIFSEFQKNSEVYKITGCTHSAALTDGDKIIAFAEDIGRHNAVDKVIGYFILEKIPFEGKMLLASGRLSSDIALKCSRCGIPVLVSRAAPTSLAIEIAESSGITLIGFARGNKMNIYTGKQRIIL